MKLNLGKSKKWVTSIVYWLLNKNNINQILNKKLFVLTKRHESFFCLKKGVLTLIITFILINELMYIENPLMTKFMHISFKNRGQLDKREEKIWIKLFKFN